MTPTSLLALLVAGSVLAPPSATTPPAASVRWAWPVGDGARPPLVAPFDAPEERWGPGHRGIDLGTARGEPVRAVDAGEVTHRGRIADRGTVTVTHANGVRSTYEPVDSAVRVGDRVRRGETIGRVGDEPGHCAPAACLHLGAKRGPTYLDPLGFFGARRVVLLPVP